MRITFFVGNGSILVGGENKNYSAAAKYQIIWKRYGDILDEYYSNDKSELPVPSEKDILGKTVDDIAREIPFKLSKTYWN